MKKCKLITEISLEDFLKLNLTAYEHHKHYFNAKGKEISYEETGEWIVDSKGGKHWCVFDGTFSKLSWDEVSLNKIVLENVEFSKKEGFENNCICVAIHDIPSDEEIKQEYEKFSSEFPKTHWTTEDMRSILLFTNSYLDKYLTIGGNQTYLLRCDVPHLYSEKRKFCTHDEYFEIPKKGTKAVYLVRY